MTSIKDTALIDTLRLDMSNIDPGDPTTFAQAERRPDAAKWLAAWDNESDNLKATSLRGPYSFSEVPSDAIIIASKVVFKLKKDGTYKARMVLRGDQQPEHPLPPDGIKETLFAPTVRLTMVRIFLALMCTIGMF